MHFDRKMMKDCKTQYNDCMTQYSTTHHYRKVKKYWFLISPLYCFLSPTNKKSKKVYEMRDDMSSKSFFINNKLIRKHKQENHTCSN